MLNEKRIKMRRLISEFLTFSVDKSRLRCPSHLVPMMLAMAMLCEELELFRTKNTLRR